MYITALAKAALVFSACSLFLGVVILATILLPTGGTEPRGICDFVEGTGGLLPLNPDDGGDYSYSCNPDWSLTLFYIFGFGAPVSVILMSVGLVILKLVLMARGR